MRRLEEPDNYSALEGTALRSGLASAYTFLNFARQHAQDIHDQLLASVDEPRTAEFLAGRWIDTEWKLRYGGTLSDRQIEREAQIVELISQWLRSCITGGFSTGSQGHFVEAVKQCQCCPEPSNTIVT